MPINRRLRKLEGRVITMIPRGPIHDLNTLTDDQLLVLATGKPYARAKDYSDEDLIKLMEDAGVDTEQYERDPYEDLPHRFKQLLEQIPENPNPRTEQSPESDDTNLSH